MGNVKIILFTIFSFLIFSSSLIGSDNRITNFEKARTKAIKEGKLLFIGFHAKWCSPCKWMEETTFSDQRVLSVLQNEFISIKIDIDDFEGFELKSKYDIKFLPTMIVLDRNGKMIIRIEETLSPSKLLIILDDIKLNKLKSIVHKANISPSSIATDNNSFVRTSGKAHRLQMGVFSNFELAIAKVSALNEIFIEPIVIVLDERKGASKKHYRVIMGEFRSINEAKSFKTILKDKFKLDSLVY